MAQCLGWKYEKAEAAYRDLCGPYAAAKKAGGKGLKRIWIENWERSDMEDLYLTVALTVAHSAQVERDLKGLRELQRKRGKKLGDDNVGRQLRLWANHGQPQRNPRGGTGAAAYVPPMPDAYIERLRQAWEEEEDRRLRVKQSKVRSDKGKQHAKRQKPIPTAMDKEAQEKAAKRIADLAKATGEAKRSEQVLDLALLEESFAGGVG